MSATDLIETIIAWSPARHAVERFLDLCELPCDPDPLADWIYDGRSPELVLGAAPVRPVGDDLFEIDDAGTWAVLQPVSPDGQSIVDLIAWHPSFDRWRLLTGVGDALGERELSLRLDLAEPIRVYATPRAWHRACGRGVCLLRREWPVAQRLLGGEREIIVVDDIELGDWLDHALRFRPAPAVLVEEMDA